VQGAKMWNSEIWPLLPNLLLRCRTDSVDLLVQQLRDEIAAV